MLTKVLKASNARKPLSVALLGSSAARSFRTSQAAANKFNIFIDDKPVMVSPQNIYYLPNARLLPTKILNITKFLVSDSNFLALFS